MKRMNTNEVKNALLELVDYIGEKDARIEIKDIADSKLTRITVRIPDGRCESRDIDFVEEV